MNNLKRIKKGYLIIVTFILTLGFSVAFSSIASTINNPDTLDKIMLNISEYVVKRLDSIQPEIVATDSDNQSIGAYQHNVEQDIPVIDQSGGYYSELPITLTGTDATLSVGGTLTVTGATSLETLTKGGGTLATTTGATGVIRLADLDVEHVLEIEPLLFATTAATLTFDASSTLSTLVPNSGDSRTYDIYISTTTPYALTLAGGTGTILDSSSSTSVTLEGNMTTLEMVRLANTDIILKWNNN